MKEPTPARLHIRVPSHVRAHLEQLAATEGRSLSDVVRRLLAKSLKGEK